MAIGLYFLKLQWHHIHNVRKGLRGWRGRNEYHVNRGLGSKSSSFCQIMFLAVSILTCFNTFYRATTRSISTSWAMARRPTPRPSPRRGPPWWTGTATCRRESCRKTGTPPQREDWRMTSGGFSKDFRRESCDHRLITPRYKKHVRLSFVLWWGKCAYARYRKYSTVKRGGKISDLCRKNV